MLAKESRDDRISNFYKVAIYYYIGPKLLRENIINENSELVIRELKFQGTLEYL